jgi:hypothetical protein
MRKLHEIAAPVGEGLLDLVLAIFGICALLSGTIHLVAQSHLYGFEE